MASKLTPTEKMELWHEGRRILNVKACSDSKLMKYLEICNGLGFAAEAGKLKRELSMRGFSC